MKLKNKKTGKIGEVIISIDGDYYVVSPNKFYEFYDSPTELAKEWEEYEEPKTFFTIYYDGTISEFRDEDDEQIRDMKSIGNYFETREEAEKAVEKLKALQRLQKKFDFHITGWEFFDTQVIINTDFTEEFVRNSQDDGIWDDLDLLFGGEE